ncbi:hypothetical protein D3C72_1356800 [compost metagenome]
MKIEIRINLFNFHCLAGCARSKVTKDRFEFLVIHFIGTDHVFLKDCYVTHFKATFDLDHFSFKISDSADGVTTLALFMIEVIAFDFYGADDFPSRSRVKIRHAIVSSARKVQL